jgi:transcriptional regulator with XRE-family HTH domain
MLVNMTDTLLAGVGASVAAHRRACGITQADLAARVGRSVQWVSAVEQGRRFADRLSDLVAIASVVGCTMDDLLGRPVDSLTTPGVHPRAGNVEGVRAVLLRSAVPASGGGPAPDLAEVGQRVAQAWVTWHSSPTAHTALGTVLPGLLTDALACHEEVEDRRGSSRVLAGAWQVTRQWLHHLPEGDLAWIAAERAMAAAREADDPHLIALGAWALSGSYRRAGQPEEATRLCLSAGDAIAPLLDSSHPDPGLLAAYGMLHLAAAVSAAQSDEDGRAWALHRVADEAARALGRHYDPWTAFGRGNVDIHAIAVSAALGDADAIVDNAARLDLDDMPSTHRRACVLIDTARGFVRRGEDEAAALVLLDAEQASADEVRHSPLVREMVRELLHRDRARARTHVRGLAQRIGLLAAA